MNIRRLWLADGFFIPDTQQPATRSTFKLSLLKRETVKGNNSIITAPPHALPTSIDDRFEMSIWKRRNVYRLIKCHRILKKKKKKGLKNKIPLSPTPSANKTSLFVCPAPHRSVFFLGGKLPVLPDFPRLLERYNKYRQHESRGAEGRGGGWEVNGETLKRDGR